VSIQLAAIGTAVRALALAHNLPGSFNSAGLTNAASVKFYLETEQTAVDVVVAARGETKANRVNNVEVLENHDR